MLLTELDAGEAARGLEANKFTSEALVTACLERIAAREEAVRAWAFVDREAALAQARALDRAPPPRPVRVCTACLSVSRTSSTRRSCRPNTTRRSTAATGRKP